MELREGDEGVKLVRGCPLRSTGEKREHCVGFWEDIGGGDVVVVMLECCTIVVSMQQGNRNS